MPNVHLDQLCSAMQHARLVLRRCREERRFAVEQYVGAHWSEEGARKKVPVNLLSLYVSVVGRNLIAKNPRVMLSTFDRSNKPAVNAMQDWANKEIERMHLADTLQRIVLDALFSVGIGKVAISTPSDAAIGGWVTGAGTPFCERVDLDDFVFDIHCRDFREASFMGHRFRMPKEVANAMFGRKARDLTVSQDPLYNEQGDERISVIGRGMYGDTEEFEEHVDLWEVYLPRHKVVLTLADEYIAGPTESGSESDPFKSALHTQNWLGPIEGPYHLLALGVVPGNAMPKSPIQDLVDLHMSVNGLYRKADRQGENQKNVLAVAMGSMEDGQRIKDASDMDIIQVNNPQAAVPIQMNGANKDNLALAVHLKDLFSWLGGNLDMMGGLSPQSKTLGQDQLLAQNASRAVSDMQDRTTNFTAECLKALCWYWWHDPRKVMRVNHQIPGLPGKSILRQVGPDKRTGNFDDLQIDVDPYSMQHSTPQSRLAALNQIVTQTLIPMMPILQQQGIMFDVNAYLQKVAQYLDMPDLADIITIQEPPQGAQPDQGGGAGGMPQPGKPATTSREYTRRSVGQDTGANRASDFMNQLMTKAPGRNGQPVGAPVQ
jgi:hypothetical protein